MMRNGRYKRRWDMTRHHPGMRLLLVLAALPVLALSCADDYDTWLDGRCFRMSFHTFVFHSEASEQCAQDAARLPAIRTAEENDQYFAALKHHGSGPFSFWLSLVCDGRKFVWADGTEATYTNFAGDYNCSIASTSSRYYVDDDRLWYESTDGNNIYKVNNVVCEAPARSASPCDSFDLLSTGKSKDACYRLQPQEQTWQQAENSCKEQGAHLAVIHDETMNDFIRREAVANGFQDGVHIGIIEDDAGNFNWTDGSEMDYKNYAPGMIYHDYRLIPADLGFPNEAYGNCVAMETGFQPGQWMNIDCYVSRLPSVCTKSAYYPANPQPAGCPVKKQNGPGDEIFSPSYPEAPGVSGCDYLLLVPDQNKRAEIEIDFFESNSCCDTLTIYDGLFGSNILKEMTGYYPSPVSFRASSNAIRLRWNATSGANVRGFHAKLTSCC